MIKALLWFKIQIKEYILARSKIVLYGEGYNNRYD